MLGRGTVVARVFRRHRRRRGSRGGVRAWAGESGLGSDLGSKPETETEYGQQALRAAV